MKQSNASLCLHDVRLSWGRRGVEMISNVMNRFNAPLTVHLVCDIDISSSKEFSAFIKKHTASGMLEIVFHGTTHLCSVKVFRMFSFYHKYQAEYLVDDEQLRTNSAKAYSKLAKLLGYKPGICPPCWLSVKKNSDFFESLSPDYTETMFHIRKKGKGFFSPIISLGSPEKTDLVFLKIAGAAMKWMSIFLPGMSPRMAIHVCDIDIESSMDFFDKTWAFLLKKTFKPVLQKDLFLK